MSKWRICSKVKATDVTSCGSYVIESMKVDQYRQWVKDQNENQTEIEFWLEKEPEKLPKHKRERLTMTDQTRKKRT